MPVSRELQITYGGFPVGGDSAYQITDSRIHSVGKDLASVEFTFAARGDTSEDFASACKAAEEAFRTPYQDLVVSMSGSRILALRQSDSSGLDAEPEISKVADDLESGRSCLYRVRIQFGVPADTASMAGRRDSTIEIEYSASRRRTVTFSGTWTADGSTNARDNYTSSAPTWMAAAISALGGTFEIVEESVSPSTNDKTCAFRKAYKEIFRAQSGSGTDDTGIVDPVLVITRRHLGPGVTATPISAKPLIEIECRMSCGIDHTIATGLSAKWNAIKSWLVTQVQNYLGGGSFAVTELAPEFDEHEHRLSVVLRGVGTDAGSGLLESAISVRDVQAIGREFVPIWSGNPLSAYVYDGPAVLVRTISWTARKTGNIITRIVMNLFRGLVQGSFLYPPFTDPNPSRGRWVETDQDMAVDAKRLGTSPWQIDVTDIQATLTYRWVLQIYAVATSIPRLGEVPGPPAGRQAATE